MATNNQTKAPRPCTLWGQTFDSNLVVEVNAIYDHVYIVLHGKIIDSYYNDDQSIVTEMLFEAIQAIASAQRPWLKAEGFQFVEREVYLILLEGGYFFPAIKITHNDFTGWVECYSNGYMPYYPSKDNNSINPLAFKPISDSQEAWDTVAYVEVYREVE